MKYLSFQVKGRLLSYYIMLLSLGRLWFVRRFSPGKGNVWCLYPNKNAAVKSVQDAFGQELLGNYEAVLAKTKEDKALNFILIDGTWSNSATMFRRL
ncbi:hypothetical protein K1719_011207 [Acacia pycnantha]|nr:hypothetical protein K1719_011207 [Acacia pycnantha]